MFSNYDDILTVEQLMEMLYIGKNTAYTLLNNGTISAFKIGRVWKIPRESLKQYIINQSKRDFSCG